MSPLKINIFAKSKTNKKENDKMKSRIEDLQTRLDYATNELKN